MTDYGLGPNEVLLVECKGVERRDGKFFEDGGDLALTNEAVLFAVRGKILGGVKYVDRMPLRSLKVYGNQVQIKLEDRKDSEYARITLYFQNEQVAFGGLNKTEAREFISTANKVLTGVDSAIAPPSGNAIPGTEFIAKTLRGTIDTFKNSFGIKPKKADTPNVPETVAMTCPSCGAPISGFKGSVGVCEYCGMKYNLQ